MQSYVIEHFLVDSRTTDLVVILRQHGDIGTILVVLVYNSDIFLVDANSNIITTDHVYAY